MLWRFSSRSADVSSSSLHPPGLPAAMRVPESPSHRGLGTDPIPPKGQAGSISPRGLACSGQPVPTPSPAGFRQGRSSDLDADLGRAAVPDLSPEPCCSMGLLLNSQLCISTGCLGSRLVFLRAAAATTGLTSPGGTQSCVGTES